MNGNITNETSIVVDNLSNLVDIGSDIQLLGSTANFSATFQRALDSGDA